MELIAKYILPMASVFCFQIRILNIILPIQLMMI